MSTAALERIKKSFLASVATARDLLYQGDASEAEQKERRAKVAVEQRRQALAQKREAAREEQAKQERLEEEDDDEDEDKEATQGEPKDNNDDEGEKRKKQEVQGTNLGCMGKASRKRRHVEFAAGAASSENSRPPPAPKDGTSPSALSASKQANKRQRKESGGVKNLRQDFSKVTNSVRRTRPRWWQKNMTPKQKEMARRRSTTYTAMDGTQSSQLVDDDSETEDEDEEEAQDGEEENDTVNDQRGAQGKDLIAEEDDDIECYSEDQEKNETDKGCGAAVGSAAAAVAAAVEAGAAPAPSTTVFYDRLQEAKRMRDAKLISQDDFDGLKGEIIDAMMQGVRKPAASKRPRPPPPPQPPQQQNQPQKGAQAKKKAKLKMLPRMSSSQ